MKLDLSPLFINKKFPGPWGGVLGAILFFSILALLPGKAFASVSYGTMFSYQMNESSSGAAKTTSSIERFSFFFNLNTKASSRLSLNGNLRFDVNMSQRGTSESTAMSPNINIRITTKALQSGIGVRWLIRDDSVISGGNTSIARADSKDYYADATLKAGVFPALRLRYGMREQKMTRDGVLQTDSGTNDFSAGTNFRLGPFGFNADYRTASTKDRLTGAVSDTWAFAGQTDVARSIGSRMAFSLRENFAMDGATANGVETAKRYSSIAQASFNYNPFRGANINTNYVYRFSEDLLAATGVPVDKSWVTSASYALPRFMRFYGLYLKINSDTPGASAETDVMIGGTNFSNTIGRFSLAARYEARRTASSSTSGGVTTRALPNTANNIDWVISAPLSRFFNFVLSEALVYNTVGNSTNSNNHFRLGLNIGPIKTLFINPAFDYNIATAPDGKQTKSAVLAVPVTFRLNLHEKVDFTLNETYNANQVSSESGSTTNQQNNLVARLSMREPVPHTNVTAEASYNMNMPEGGEATQNSSYMLGMNWTKRPHQINTNLRYQTTSAGVSSLTMSGQYTLGMRLKKLSMSFSARYDYSQAYSLTSTSTSQVVYLSLSLRK